MIPVSQLPLTLLLVLWQGLAVAGIVALSMATPGGRLHAFFSRHRIAYGLLWLVVVPVAGAYILLTIAGFAALGWLWITGALG